MKASFRLSPVGDLLRQLNGSWHSINGMPALLSLPEDESTAVHLGIADLSFLTRFGVKGAEAAHWLESQDIPVPDRPNTWCPLTEGSIVARLGMNEFLIEDSLHSAIAARLTKECQRLPTKVYPVLRQDLAIALWGSSLNDLLLQTCSFNFRALPLADRPVILTSAIGVAVIVIPGERGGRPFYRIWCDGTFGVYLWKMLVEIARELGGGVIGAERLVDPL